MEDTIVSLMVFFVLVYSGTSAQNIGCTTSDVIGAALTQRAAHASPVASGYLLKQGGGVQCYGNVQEWSFHHAGQTCDSITFQIWRGVANNDYQLIGQNEFDNSNCNISGGISSYAVPGEKQIAVRPGDVMGINFRGYNATIYYDSGPGPASGMYPMVYYSDVGNVPVGGVHTWPIRNVVSREYSLIAILKPGTPPTLINLPNNVSLYEHVPVGTLVFHVRGSDVDNGSLSYFIIDTKDTFEINKDSGVIKSKTIFDATVRKVYIVNVTVSDGWFNVSGTLTVNILPVNKPHRITNLPAFVTIDAQSTSKTTQVFKVLTADDGLSTITFMLLTQDPPDGLFDIVSSTGVVTCTQDLKNWQGATEYTLNISAVDADYTDGPKTLVIYITNTIQAPRFLNLPGTTTIRENTETSRKIYQVKASDIHSRTIQYSISTVSPVNGTGKFSIDPTGGTVTCSASPNFDVQDVQIYTLRISATNGQIEHYGSLNVEIIETIRHFSISNLPHTADISAKYSLAGDEVFEVKINETLVRGLNFSIISSLPSPSPFEIGVKDGVIRCTSDLRKWAGPATVSLNITAYNAALVSGPSTLTIQLSDLWPKPKFLNLPNETTIEEDVVGDVFGILLDVNDTTEVTYEITNVFPLTGVSKFLFNSSHKGFISVAAENCLNALKDYQYILTIIARDGLHTSEQANLTVNVRAVNRPHSIKNSSTNFIVSAQTSNCPDHKILNVGISDLYDESGVQYKILASEPSQPVPPFTINPSKGAVTCTQSLKDWTGPRVYLLTISAADKQFHDVINVSIEITDMKQAPRYNHLNDRISIPENSPTGIIIYNLTSNPSDQVTYALLDVLPESGLGMFSVNQSAGTVKLINVSGLNFESGIRQYILTINQSTNLFKSNRLGNLTIDITDVNERPVFEPSTYFSSFPEQTTGTVVRLYASDVDETDKDGLDYTILSTTDAEHFRINMADDNIGYVYITKMFDLTAGVQSKNVTLSIATRDHAALEDTATITIQIYDVNNHNPVFNNKSYIGMVYENTTGGDPVLSLTSLSNLVIQASDDDAGQNANVSYYIDPTSAGNNFFQVHPESGNITVKYPIDYEVYHSITFNVVAEDNGSPSARKGQAEVTILVMDNNDNRPQFEQSWYDLEVRTDVPVNHYVTQLPVIDQDSGANGNVSYFLLTSNDHFMIDYSSGVISVKSDLSAERRHLLYCYARDNAVPPETELYSDPIIVRIDSFTPWRHLVDITLMLPLQAFTGQSKVTFLDTLNVHLHPWVVKEDNTKLLNDQTVISIYALGDNTTAEPENIGKTKQFVWRNELLHRLRYDIHGKPRDWLLRSEFDTFQPIKVMPSYPIWVIDTVAGIVTLCLCSLLLLIVVFIVVLLLSRKFGWFCYSKPATVKKIQVAPAPEPYTEKEEFNLQYWKDPNDTQYMNYAPKESKEQSRSVLVPAQHPRSVDKLNITNRIRSQKNDETSRRQIKEE